MLSNSPNKSDKAFRRPTIPSMKRRAPWHDYSAKGLYLITLVVEGRRPLLGRLMGSPRPHVELSPLGYQLLNEEIAKIPAVYSNTRVMKTTVMPDHIHFILHVFEPFQQGKKLGNVIKGFKTGCNKAYYRLIKDAMRDAALFEEGFNDKILLNAETLSAWIHYLDDNPRRLWLKRSRPDYFTVMHNREIGGTACEMVGNIFLLDVPDKEAVIVHRHQTEAEFNELKRHWLKIGACGGVLVSAAISPREKEVMREAMNSGYRIILLRQTGFPKLYKPAGEAFDACVEGLLLQISPWQYSTRKETITREQCLALNRLAETICSASEAGVSGRRG